MTTPPTLRQLGTTRQRLLRRLLAAPQGESVEALCTGLGISHNAVRQHLTALLCAGLVERGSTQPSGGRPQARYLISARGRELFPRNYGLIAGSLLEQLYESQGRHGVQATLAAMGARLGAAAAQRLDAVGADERIGALAEQMDALGYEALAVQRDGEAQIEAYNCVFHALARAHPDVCRFDLAFMEAATGQPVQHLECIVRGGHVCRFRIGSRNEKVG